jgi:hypothetical protein
MCAFLDRKTETGRTVIENFSDDMMERLLMDDAVDDASAPKVLTTETIL